MLESICAPIIDDEQIEQVVDLFAGAGSVGYALAPYKKIISNDIEYYSYVLNEGILNGCEIDQDDLQSLLLAIEHRYQIMKDYLCKEIAIEAEKLSAPLDTYEEYAAFSNNTPSVFGTGPDDETFDRLQKLVSQVKPGAEKQHIPFPCLFTTYFANSYFGIAQCCQIDAISSTIHELEDQRLRFVLLTALMSVMSMVSSSTTHFAQFLTVKSKNTFKNIRDKRSTNIIAGFTEILQKYREAGLLNQKNSSHKCYNLDFEECLKSIEIDEHTLIYADPPYFKEHYSRYYHVLNTLCFYDYPELAVNPQSKELSIGRYRTNRNASDFGKRAKVLSAFSRLINMCADKNAELIISYSENSLVKIHELLKLAEERYNVQVNKVVLKHSSQGRATESDQNVKEFLFHCTVRNPTLYNIEELAYTIRKIKPIVDNPGGFIHNYMARKPYNVVSAIIEGLTNQGDLVYDPMFGSGTALIEASKLGRRAIGTDINPVAVEICKTSLRRWDLERINLLIDQFVSSIEKECTELYIHEEGGEERVIERCHFDFVNNRLMPTSYWYKVRNKEKYSGRRKSDASVSFCEQYNRLGKIEKKRIHDHPLMTNSRIAIKENATVFSYFCNRNLIAIDKILSVLDNYIGSYGYEVIRLLVSSSINLIKLSDKKASSQMPYWLPKTNATSRNAVFIIKQKATAMKEGLRYLHDTCHSFVDDGEIQIYNIPAQSIGAELKTNSVDLILTDPPYTDQVPYLEYNQLWFYILEMDKNPAFIDELVVSDAPARNKNQDEFDVLFRRIIKRASDALKEERPFVMFYHTFDLKSWANLLTMMHENQLRYVYQIPTAAPRKSFKTIMSPKSTLDGNYLLFFIKDRKTKPKEFNGTLSDAVEKAKACAEKIICSRKEVTTQDLYDLGMLKESFEDGYLTILAEKFRTFADVIKDYYKYENGFWEVLK